MKIELRLNKRTIELHSHLENNNESSENTTNDARHFHAKLSTTTPTNSAAASEQYLSRRSESVARLSPFGEKNATIPQSQSMTGEEFVLQIAKHILALHLATVDEENTTNTSMVFRIVFKPLQLRS